MFKIGDGVRIKESAKGKYTFTWPGSTGVVVEPLWGITKDRLFVMFDYISNPKAQHSVGNIYVIKVFDLEYDCVIVDHELIS